MAFAAGFEKCHRSLDNYITGHGGEDQFLGEHSVEDDDGYDEQQMEINLAAFEREQELRRLKRRQEKEVHKDDHQRPEERGSGQTA